MNINKTAVISLALVVLLPAMVSPVRAQTTNPQPTFVVSEADYWTTLVVQSNVLAQALTGFSPLLDNPTLDDPAWTVVVATHVSAARMAHQQIALIQPLPILAETHGLVLTGVDDCRRALDTFAVAVEQRNAMVLGHALTHLTNCDHFMQYITVRANGIGGPVVAIRAPMALPIPTAVPVGGTVDAAPTTTIQPFTCIGGCITSPNPACNIKGNVNERRDTWIYHTPGSRYYDETQVNPEEGDRWFCTVQEAQDAGFRPPEQ